MAPMFVAHKRTQDIPSEFTMPGESQLGKTVILSDFSKHVIAKWSRKCLHIHYIIQITLKWNKSNLAIIVFKRP